MVKILPIDVTSNHIQEMNIHEGEDIVKRSFTNVNELVDTIMKQPDVFTAMRLVNEINELNGYNVISKYDVKEIKNYYRDSSISNGEHNILEEDNSETNSSSETIFCKSNLNEDRLFLSSYKSNLDSDKVYSHNSQIKMKRRQSLFSGDEKSKSGLSDLQKAYAEMGFM